MDTDEGRYARRFVLAAIAIAIAAAGFGSGSAQAATPFRDIVSAGPIQHIYSGADLSCQVKLTGDADWSFFPGRQTPPPTDPVPADCGTFLAAGGVLYAPDFVQHPYSAADTNLPPPFTPFTAVAQSPVSGTGTNDDPLVVSTVADAAASGLRVSRSDAYQPGESFYTSAVTVSNATGAPVQATVYHGGDCFLANDDTGYGHVVAATGGVFCAANANNQPAGRLIGFVPFEPAAFVETQYTDLLDPAHPRFWSLFSSAGTPFPSTCRCGDDLDNAAGLSWSFAVPAGGSVTRRFISTISATGIDNDPPETQITKGPAVDEVLPVQSASFEFTADEPGAKYECEVDDGGFAPCSSPFATAALEDGGHRFEVRAIDPDGNVDPTPAERPFATLTKPCAARTVTIFARFGQDVIVGTPGDDVILGTPQTDVVDAGPGNDAVCDREGPDLIKGGPGKDKLRGGPGEDKITGGGGKDILSGRDDSDRLSGGPGDDFLNGNPGADRLNGGAGTDTCKGGSGKDKETECERG